MRTVQPRCKNHASIITLKCENWLKPIDSINTVVHSSKSMLPLLTLDTYRRTKKFRSQTSDRTAENWTKADEIFGFTNTGNCSRLIGIILHGSQVRYEFRWRAETSKKCKVEIVTSDEYHVLEVRYIKCSLAGIFYWISDAHTRW